MKKVLIYVLSSHERPYEAMIENSMQTWDRDPVADTKTVFYCGNPVGGDTERVISFPVQESYANIARKNIMAFRKALEWEWDYMARVNASCYVHKRRLLEHCQTLPEKNLLRAIMCGPTIYCGVNRDWAWGGAQFILSRDLVERIVENENLWNHLVMEDVALSEITQHLGVEIDRRAVASSINKHEDGTWGMITYGGESPSFNFSDFSEVNKAPDQFFFRVKHDPDRRVDGEVMRLLKEHLKP